MIAVGGGRHGTVKLYSTTDGTVLHEMPLPGSICDHIAFSPHGGSVACSVGNTLLTFSIVSGETLRAVGVRPSTPPNPRWKAV